MNFRKCHTNNFQNKFSTMTLIKSKFKKSHQQYILLESFIRLSIIGFSNIIEILGLEKCRTNY